MFSRLTPLLRGLLGLMAVLTPLVCGEAAAQGAGAAEVPLDRAAIAAGLCTDAGDTLDRAADALGDASDDDLAFLRRITDALMGRNLVCGETVAIKSGGGTVDALTGAPADASGKTPVLNLRNRASAENLGAALTLLTPSSASDRDRALRVLARRPQGVSAAALARAAEAALDDASRAAIEELAVVASLASEDVSERIAAVEALARTPNRRNLGRLEALKGEPAYEGDTAFRDAVDAAIGEASTWVRIADALSVLFSGLSYASILFIAAVGLAIVFGLMGVINLAHGEFIMIGAYVTFMVQEVLRALAPALVDWYLILAIPFTFLVTAAIGVAIELLVVRHLYRRPLMTLLATWAVSLFLVNIVRVTFGTQNLAFATPSYISGGFTLIGDFIVTQNRLFAIVFALVVLAATWLILKKTPFGLNVRAVTQNREMASAIGIATRRVDMLAFGLGSGLAGLAGLALAPIYNVNPLMGTNFIIESFMVVVLGGVGSLAGTLIAALGIGQINVLIEPIWGAVAAKVIVLLLIIAFIQRRPEGLFAAPGRRK
ncbi:urea ABC transporter permease subunit UrtB [Acuticoccus sediminis]|uniref:urea ABC transporter permease subunit UrtB n=1 Tax=Acuticoccus sediminis TaxID=2184697 RepID=UPI00192E6370|nr:urea ABC transporter permease subunit UrtB [Acuticoccus sediminis]